jgi:biopolymer transport protein ExbB
VVSLLWAGVLAVLLPTAPSCAEEAKAPAGDAKPEKPAAPPTAEAASEPGAKKEPPAAASGTKEPEGKPAAKSAPEKPPEKTSVLAWAWKALGLFYTTAFLGLSFTFVALFVMNVLTARREAFCPETLIDGFETHLKQNEYQEAYDLARQSESFLGQVLSAGLARLSYGYTQAIEAMQEVAEEENMKLEHRLSHIALIGTISPMVGLFGTVDGMIRSFSVIATSTTTPKPSQLADGVATALVTTLVGLAIAIPAVGVYTILKNRVARLVLEVGIVSEGLMRSAMENAKKK